MNLPYSPVTLGSLTLDASNDPTFTLTGAASVAFSSSGSAISATGTSGTATIAGLVPIQIAAGSVNVDTGVSLLIGATIQDGTSATALDKVGGGSLILSGSNGYGGGTDVEDGTLIVEMRLCTAQRVELDRGGGGWRRRSAQPKSVRQLRAAESCRSPNRERLRRFLQVSSA